MRQVFLLDEADLVKLRQGRRLTFVIGGEVLLVGYERAEALAAAHAAGNGTAPHASASPRARRYACATEGSPGCGFTSRSRAWFLHHQRVAHRIYRRKKRKKGGAA